jgi:hypothetical protein
MIVLALLLLIIVLVFSVAIVVSNPDVYQLSLFRVLVPVTSAGVFFTGFGAALVTIIALLLLRTGIRRSRETRRRLRTAEQSATSSAAGTPSGGSDPGRPADRDSSRGDPDPDSSRDRGAPNRLAEPATTGVDEGGPADPVDGPSTSKLDLDPGEDATTVPVDRRKTRRRGSEDRDEPRT